MSTQLKPATSSSVLRAIAGIEDSRSRIIAAFKAKRGNLDRWEAMDRVAMALAITKEEDWLEYDGGRSREVIAYRKALQTVRRVLE